EYKQKTGLVFVLESLKNFAAKGRVYPAVAKIAGVLGIRVVGKASTEGTLEPTDKCRGAAKSITALVNNLLASGLSHGKIRIAHCCNETAAKEITQIIQEKLPHVDIKTHTCLGLCSYYAEKGGILVGFEKF
ncbi:MAG: DegV family protein, partial [Clostridia bacterium]|nr:DegV family protein [Clostridia bacterium]